MKIIHFSYSDTVGAFAAAYELHKEMVQQGEESTFVVREKTRDDENVVELEYEDTEEERLDRAKNLLYVKRDSAPENAGCNFDEIGLSKQRVESLHIQEYDIIHIHWVTGLLSADNIRFLIDSEKPVFWTMHDFHPFTGVCHYPIECNEYKNACEKCDKLKKNYLNISQRIFLKKKMMYGWGAHNLKIIVASEWLKSKVRESYIFEKNQCVTIPIGIDTKKFVLRDKTEERKKFGFGEDEKIILIGAQSVGLKLKGYLEINKILEIIKKNDNCGITDKLRLVIFGESTESLSIENIKKTNMGFIADREKLCGLYNAADVFLFLSTQETFGMTAVESMACGTPVVAYNVCAMHEVIKNDINGWKVEVDNLLEVAEKTMYFLGKEDFDREKCRNLVENYYSLRIEADTAMKSYRNFYNEIRDFSEKENQQVIKNTSIDFFEDCKKEIKDGIAVYQDELTKFPVLMHQYNPLFMSMRRKIKTLLPKGVLDNKNIYLYGAGVQGSAMLRELHSNNLKVTAFYDSNRTICGTVKEGVVIMPLKQKTNCWNGIILISCEAYVAVSDILKKEGYLEGIDFF